LSEFKSKNNLIQLKSRLKKKKKKFENFFKLFMSDKKRKIEEDLKKVKKSKIEEIEMK
jgi:hypothetical protein